MQEPKTQKFTVLRITVLRISVWSLMQNRHWGARRTHEPILFLLYTRLLNIFCNTLSNRLQHWQVWSLTLLLTKCFQ